jgi:isoleucyl-tRNA synthetase
MDQLFNDLNDVTQKHKVNSVHLAQFPLADEAQIDLDLEHKMDIAQRTSSLVLSLRKREKLKVRQPLQRIMIPALDKKFVDAVMAVKELILSEVNVKELELIDDTSGILTKRIKPNFKTIGKKYGQQMKAISAMVAGLTQQEIALIEKQKGWNGMLDGVEVDLSIEDFEIIADDIPGWLVAVDGNLTVALDANLNAALIEEGIAREFVNRIQNLRKDNGFEVTDRILLTIKSDDKINEAIKNNLTYICSETLADSLQLVDSIEGNKTLVEIDEIISTEIGITKTELN